MQDAADTAELLTTASTTRAAVDQGRYVAPQAATASAGNTSSAAHAVSRRSCRIGG